MSPSGLLGYLCVLTVLQGGEEIYRDSVIVSGFGSQLSKERVMCMLVLDRGVFDMVQIPSGISS